ncbi:MAG TPA: hypothetical protein VKW04_18155 [Planctomycetota bacterium]|nr:hypothetical protein [Planctomycetota bacterium]
MNQLPGAALRLRDPGAEEAFRKIEETLVRARTLTLKFLTDGVKTADGTRTAFKVAGTFALKTGDRVNLSIRTQATEGTETRYVGTGWAISNGTRWQQQHGDRDCEIQPVPAGLVSQFTLTLLRCGAYSAFILMLSNPSLKVLPRIPVEEGQDLRKMLAVSDLKPGPDDREAKTLSYALRSSGAQADFSASGTLRYHPETWMLLGRTLTVKGREGAETTLTERYDDVKIDSEIPDEQFKVPD